MSRLSILNNVFVRNVEHLKIGFTSRSVSPSVIHFFQTLSKFLKIFIIIQSKSLKLSLILTNLFSPRIPLLWMIIPCLRKIHIFNETFGNNIGRI